MINENIMNNHLTQVYLKSGHSYSVCIVCCESVVSVSTETCRSSSQKYLHVDLSPSSNDGLLTATYAMCVYSGF